MNGLSGAAQPTTGGGGKPGGDDNARHGPALPGPDCQRLSIYMVCLGVSFGLMLVAGGRNGAPVPGNIFAVPLQGGGLVFWVLAGFAALGMAVGALAPAIGGADLAGPRLALGRLPHGAAVVAAGLALLGAAGGGGPAWPSVLVLLFAGRVLMEIADLRLWLAWQAPLRRHPPASVQSVAAALTFGGFLTLVFEQAIALAIRTPGLRAAFTQGAGEGGPTSASIAVDALLGDTPVHRALIFLFFVVAALIADAWRLHLRDRAALVALGALLPRPSAAGALAHGVARLAPAYPGSRALLACRTIADETDAAGHAAFRAASDFHLASRRLVRSIVPLLPLLGFVGTVIGLSITLGELPRSTADGARAAADISASLGGLAIKFQTTLLGLVGGMVASTALNALEKAETELAAECALVVAATARAPEA